MSTNATVQDSHSSHMTPALVKSQWKEFREELKDKQAAWDHVSITHVEPMGLDEHYNSPQTKTVKDAVAAAATTLYASLNELHVLDKDAPSYFKRLRQVRKNKWTLRSTIGYDSLTAKTRGTMVRDETQVIDIIYAHSCNVETGGSISEIPATEQGVKDYFEIEDPCSVPPVCASCIHFDNLANRHSDGESSLASIVYHHCALADCQDHKSKRRRPICDGLSRTVGAREYMSEAVRGGMPAPRCEFADGCVIVYIPGDPSTVYMSFE